MMKLTKVMIVRRWCWRSMRRAGVVLYPQEVTYFGWSYFGELGEGVCTGCGRRHVVFSTASVEIL